MRRAQLRPVLALAAMALLIVVAGCASARERQAFAQWNAARQAPVVLSERSYVQDDLPQLAGDSTLSDYLAYAALNNAELEAAFYRWKAELEKVEQVRTLPDPRFNYGYFIREVETRVGPQEHRFGISQMFPWFGKLRLRGEAALEMADAAHQQYEAIKLKLFYRVKNAYYEYYYLGHAIGVTKENIELMRQFEAIAKTKYEAGKAMYADVIKAQTELDKLRDRLRTLEDLEGPILAKFNAALNRPFHAKIPWPQDVPIEHYTLDDKQLVEQLAKSNPELKGLDFLAEKEKTAVDLARKEYFPDFTLGLDYVATGSALMPGTPDDSKDPVMLMFSVNLPIWEGKYSAGVREAEARHRAALSQRADRENTLAADLKLALFGYLDASRKIALYRDAIIPKADQTLKVTQRAFETGETDFLSLVDAQRVLLEFQLIYERAVADHAQRLAELEMLIGKPLTTGTVP